MNVVETPDGVLTAVGSDPEIRRALSRKIFG